MYLESLRRLADEFDESFGNSSNIINSSTHRIGTTGLWTFSVPQNVFSAQPGGGTISLRKLYVLYVAQADEPALWKGLSSEWADGHCIWGFILVYFVFWLWLILFYADFERAQWTSMLALLSPIYEWLPTLNHPRVRFRYWGIIMVEAEWLNHFKPVSTTYQVLPFFRSIFEFNTWVPRQRQVNRRRHMEWYLRSGRQWYLRIVPCGTFLGTLSAMLEGCL